MQDNLNSSTEMKQTFLREEIVDKGYNPEHFLELLTTLKEGGQDISLWSLQELKDVVGRFREIAHYIPVRESRLPKEETEAVQKVRKCKKHQRFLNKDLGVVDVTIDKPEIVTTGGFLGFGTTSVLWYTLKTSLVQNDVRRADSDFDWLRSTLIRFHPNRIIPSLQKSKPIQPEDTKALFKRGQMIKLFIENLSKCEALFNNKLTFAFLTWGDYPRFEAFKREQTLLTSVLTPEQFTTQSGVLDSEISASHTNTIKHLTTYSNQTKEAYHEIRETLKQVHKNFEDLTASIYRIGNSFATLQQKHSDLTTAIPELEDQKFNELLIGLNNCIHEWGKTFNIRRKAVQKHLSLMFKYTTEQAVVIQKVLKKRSIFEEEYTKLRIQLHKKKERLSNYNENLKKVEIPHLITEPISIDRIDKEELNKLIPLKEFQNQRDLRQMLGVYNASVLSQFKRLQPIILERLLQAFGNMGKTILEANKAETEVASRFINKVL